MDKAILPIRVRAVFVTTAVLLLLASCPEFETPAQVARRTPTETVREFYRALRERRFQDAFAMSVFNPAIENLSREDYEELRPDFERMAGTVPAQVDITGEQVSRDAATVFLRTTGADGNASIDPVSLIRRASDSSWIIGDRETAEAVKKQGKKFFFNARLETHHGEAQKMMTRIAAAQLVYSQQHDNQFADLSTLVAAGLLPKDIEATDSAGYRFHLTLANNNRVFRAGAEPVRYNRTGRLSYYMDAFGMQAKDTGGKPFNPPERK